jgi:hypothetical protein
MPIGAEEKSRHGGERGCPWEVSWSHCAGTTLPGWHERRRVFWTAERKLLPLPQRQADLTFLYSPSGVAHHAW